PPSRPALLRRHRAAPQRRPAGRGLPRDPRDHRDRGPVRDDRPGRRGAAVRLRLQAVLAGPRGDLPGPGRRPDRDQPGPRQAGPARVAGQPLARLRRVAARGRARPRQQLRRPWWPGARRASRLRAGRRRRPGLAAVRRGAGGPAGGPGGRHAQPHVRPEGRSVMTDSLTLRPPARPAGGPGPPGPPRLPPPSPAGAARVALRSHRAQHGPPRYPGGPGRLLAEVAAAGLTGRGGAAFPVARKLAAAAEARPPPLVIANGAEGEPASSKDKSLLWIS